MIIVRKVLASILWFVIFVILALAIMVGYTLFQIDLTADEATARAAAEAMGEDLGMRYGNVMLFGSLALAVIGSVFGWLPLSRHRKR